MKKIIYLLTLSFACLLFLNACDDEGDDYPYCVECIESSPGPTTQCFSTEDYARAYMETKAYLPDTACQMYTQ